MTDEQNSDQLSALLARVTELEKRMDALNRRTFPMQVIGPGTIPMPNCEEVRSMLNPVELDEDAAKVLYDNLHDLYERD